MTATPTPTQNQQLALFSYEEIADKRLVATLQTYAQEIKIGQHRAVEHLWNNGRLLATAQELLANHHDGFLRWVGSEVGYGKSQVYRLIQLYRTFDEQQLPNLGRLQLSALYSLSTVEDQGLRDELIERSNAGEKITHGKIEEEKKDRRPPTPNNFKGATGKLQQNLLKDSPPAPPSAPRPNSPISPSRPPSDPETEGSEGETFDVEATTVDPLAIAPRVPAMPQELALLGWKLQSYALGHWAVCGRDSTPPRSTVDEAIADAVDRQWLIANGWVLEVVQCYRAVRGELATDAFLITDLSRIRDAADHLMTWKNSDDQGVPHG